MTAVIPSRPGGQFPRPGGQIPSTRMYLVTDAPTVPARVGTEQPALTYRQIAQRGAAATRTAAVLAFLAITTARLAVIFGYSTRIAFDLIMALSVASVVATASVVAGYAAWAKVMDRRARAQRPGRHRQNP